MQKSSPEFGATIWLTGLSGAGKSTIGSALARRLLNSAHVVSRLDGDELREGLCSDLGYSMEERIENVRRIGEVALFLALHGHISIVSVISPYVMGRDNVRSRHRLQGVPFIEVYVATPILICEARDSKGLYARARSGEIRSFTGISDPYEPPLLPEFVLDASWCTPEEGARRLHERLVAIGALAPQDVLVPANR